MEHKDFNPRETTCLCPHFIRRISYVERLPMNIQEISRVTIEVPVKDARKALDYIQDNGYDILSSGPKRVDFCKVDLDIFQVVGEKIMSLEPTERVS